MSHDYGGLKLTHGQNAMPIMKQKLWSLHLGGAWSLPIFFFTVMMQTEQSQRQSSHWSPSCFLFLGISQPSECFLSCCLTVTLGFIVFLPLLLIDPHSLKAPVKVTKQSDNSFMWEWPMMMCAPSVARLSLQISPIPCWAMSSAPAGTSNWGF